MENSKCKHKWVFQGSNCRKRQQGHLTYEVSRIDTYFCENCLELKEVVSKNELIYRGDSYPYWWEE